MIVLFTDFGYNGPYVGQMKSAICQAGYNGPVIDLMHDAPSFNPEASAYLLASLTGSFPAGSIFVCVVDPGVGSERTPVLLRAGGYTFIGPDNGLFNVIAGKYSDTEVYEITWRPEKLSDSFHGRDLFAPVAVNAWFEQLGESELRRRSSIENWPADLNEIVYIDNYGNCMTGITFKDGMEDYQLSCNEEVFTYARTFSEVSEGDKFWYKNSNGLVELSLNSASLAERYGYSIGDPVSVSEEVIPGLFSI